MWVSLTLVVIACLLCACGPGGIGSGGTEPPVTDSVTDSDGNVIPPDETVAKEAVTDENGDPVIGDVTLPPEESGLPSDSEESSDQSPEDVTLAPAETLSETSSETKAADDTAEEGTSDAVIDEETLPYDPSNHPGDSSLYAGVMISAVHGTGKNGVDAVVDHGFVQLYNSTKKAISLKGASLYYKTDGASPFVQFAFPNDASIPAQGYYLVRANSPSDMVESNLIMKIESFDAEWDVHIDNKEVRLLLAPSGWLIDREEDITRFDDAVSVFYASVTPHTSVYAVDDLSRSKIAVRTAKETYSGYHLANLTRKTTADLKTLCPVTSTGDTNTVVDSRLNEVVFSHPAGIYERTVSLTLSAPSGYTIYYTTDGSDPSAPSSTRRVYSSRISITDTSALSIGSMMQSWYKPSVSTMIGGKVIKAYATNGTTSTPVYTNTYFVTDDLAAYGLTVMSISIPKSEMLGSGFYQTYTGSDITADRPRGTGIIEVFDPEGNRVGNSRVEMAVSGNGSSGYGMRSLRLYYKSANNQDAGLSSDLDYDVFNGMVKDANGNAITSFSRLLLRNSGNDCGHSYMRDAYMQRVSAGLNVDTLASATTLVFINGEFWGVYNLRERYSPEYVESHYGIQKENVAIIESDYAGLVYEGNPNAEFVLSSGVAGDENDFNNLVTYMRNRQNRTLTNAEYAYICERMDIDSFIDMWVVRLYFNARDWPENNIKVWRNRNPDDPSGFNTKWHFTLLDLDMGIAYFPNGDGNNTSEYADFFSAFLNSNSTVGMMMRTLLSHSDFKEQFLIRFYDVVNDHFVTSDMIAVLENMIAERQPTVQLQTDRWKNASEAPSVSKWNSDCTDMRSFVNGRNARVFNFFYSYFGINQSYMESIGKTRVTVEYASARADVIINGKKYASGSVISFQKGTSKSLTIKVTAKAGFTVSAILFTDANGKVMRVDGAETTLTIKDSGTISFVIERNAPAIENFSEGTLVAGGTYLFYLAPNGDLYAWGDNRMGALGLETSQSVINEPTFVMSGVAKVVTSSGNDIENGSTTFATAVLTTDGKVLTVGANTCGQLGRNGTTNSTTWGQITFTGGKIKDVSMGHDHLLIVDESGNLWGIGSNTNGALGTTNVGGNVTSFVKVASGVAEASAGRRSTVYLTTDGTLWGLGDNRWDKMSLTEGDIISTPIVMGRNIVFVDSGEHQFTAVDQNGTLYYAGWRQFSSFGQGAAANNPVMAQVMTGVVKADTYNGNMVILTTKGEAYVYGLNVDNGLGVVVTGGTPQKKLTGVADVAAGYGFTAYLMSDGRLLIQGNNSYGQAGNGTISSGVSMTEVYF